MGEWRWWWWWWCGEREGVVPTVNGRICDDQKRTNTHRNLLSHAAYIITHSTKKERKKLTIPIKKENKKKKKCPEDLTRCSLKEDPITRGQLCSLLRQSVYPQQLGSPATQCPESMYHCQLNVTLLNRLCQRHKLLRNPGTDKLAHDKSHSATCQTTLTQ